MPLPRSQGSAVSQHGRLSPAQEGLQAPSQRVRSKERWKLVLASAFAVFGMSAASGQPEGGLYIAGAGFSFQVAAERALSQNPGGRRFFLLTLPPEAAALGPRATPRQRSLRERVQAGNGVLLVCQRDIESRRLDPANLAAGVVPVRGWPAQGSNALPAGQRYFPDENPAQLPAADEALRRLRSTCA
jgi:hypothetical protein